MSTRNLALSSVGILGAVLLGAVVLNALCRDAKSPKVSGQSAHPLVGPSVKPGSSELPPAPDEFRRLWPTPIAEAIPLLESLRSRSPELEAREQLSDLYQDAGFVAAARFFRNTVELANDQPVDASPVESSIAWEATQYDLSEDATTAAKKINTLLQSWQVDQAMSQVEDELQRRPSLQLVVEWSDAALMQVRVDKQEVSEEALEAALRIFITSLDEKVPLPLSVGRSDGYKTLSDVFLSLDDPYSALTAAVMALEIDQGSSEWESLGTISKKQLCERAQNLSQDLHLRQAFWPRGPDSSRACTEP